MSTERDAADGDVERVKAIAETIHPLLAGHPPDIQGAVLCDLLAMWLAGHYQGGNALTDALLAHHIATARRLVPVNIALLKARKASAS